MKEYEVTVTGEAATKSFQTLEEAEAFVKSLKLERYQFAIIRDYDVIGPIKTTRS